MKYNYHVPLSAYSRHSQYTPTYQASSYYTPSQYSPSYSSYTAAAKYTPSTHYTPARYASAYKPAYVPSYSKGSRYTARHKEPEQSPAPAIPVAPARRTVHFPNDIVFQDIVRRGDLEQIGRFMRARKVRVDALFHSGERRTAARPRSAGLTACSLAGMAALHEAVLTGNLEVVKLLVKYGADVHQRDEDGWTPLHMACSDGYPEIASYLLTMGASTEVENESGEKPADLIDPDCKDLAKLFEAGCV
ncbi:protein phosphatase 1 regulatory subunit 27 [Neosynchiropus ocellatus]